VSDETIIVRQLTAKDVGEASELVIRVFNEFVAAEYSAEGVEEFHRYARPDALRDRAQGNHLGLLALVQDAIVGVIEVRGQDHISLLFVDPAYQRQGIARRLLRRALQISGAVGPGPGEISVNSSTYAVPIYEKLGFRQAGERQVVHGIGFTPMVLRCSDLPGKC